MASQGETVASSSGSCGNEGGLLDSGGNETQSMGSDNPWNVSPAVTQSDSLASISSSRCVDGKNMDYATKQAIDPPSPSLSIEEKLATEPSQHQSPLQGPKQSVRFSLSTVTGMSQVLPDDTEVAADRSSNNTTRNPEGQNLDLDTSDSSHQEQNPEDKQASYEEGGRLWQAALLEAERENSQEPSKPRSRFAESIMERTRSRADPNALVSSSSNALGAKQFLVSIGDNDGSFILSTALAKKRVRVVQLLLIGLVGLLLGLLGNFFVNTSCHFATVNIMVGHNEKTFEFHFGLWKYSPIESVFQGYPYCFKYDQNYANEAPIVARVANVVALVAGLFAIGILWLYLIFGSTDKRRWKWAVRIAAVASFLQLTTLYFFVGKICQEYSCEFGPGAYLAVFTSVVWFVLACEMHYHMPIAIYASGGMSSNTIGALEEPSSLVSTMEMTHVEDVTREYITRVTGKTKEDEMPALNMDLKRVRPRSGLYSPTSTNGTGLYIPSPRGTYQAPDPILLEEGLLAPSNNNR